MSSGCATMASARLQSSGSGSSGGGMSMGSSMPRIRLAAQGRSRLAGHMTDIVELERHDEAALREFYDVEVAAQTADRPYAVLRTFPQLCQMARGGSAYFQRTFLVARERGRIVGTADLGRSLRDNLHLADVEVRVLPDARRRGIGRALHDEAVARGRADGRSTFLGEAHQPTGSASSPATAFACALGYVDV